MVKLSLTNEEIDRWDSQKWTLGEDDTWWYDLRCTDFKQDWECDELINSINQDIKDNLNVDEIYVKYEKIKYIQ